MAAARQVLDIARAQLGTRESPSGSNAVKYNTAYYGRAVYDGLWGTTFPWCVVFCWWCFREAGASELFFGGGKTASCTELRDWAKRSGRWVTGDYRPGDVVIYDWHDDGRPDHCGIVETAGGSSVVVIEGNTAIGNDSNGGEVMRRTRALGDILGAYRPAYEEDDMDIIDIEHLSKAELVRLAERMFAALGEEVVSDTLAPELAEAVAAGITDGTRPNAPCTRAQAAVMVKRSLDGGRSSGSDRI